MYRVVPIVVPIGLEVHHVGDVYPVEVTRIHCLVSLGNGYLGKGHTGGVETGDEGRQVMCSGTPQCQLAQC